MSAKRSHRDYSPAVLTAMQEDEVLKTHAHEIKEIYNQRNAPPFEVAFFVFDRYKIWRHHNDAWGFNFYLYNLITVGKLKSKRSTLKLSYKVAACFPDLRDPSKRILSFNCYREIVNTKLLQDQMNELRQEAEEQGYSGRKIRKIVKQILGAEGENEEEKPKSFQKYISYRDNEQFLKAVKDMLEDPDFSKENGKFLIKKIRR